MKKYMNLNIVYATQKWEYASEILWLRHTQSPMLADTMSLSAT